MTEKPLVSVIVPIYGVEKYLDECIISIINQTYDNIEIILVDDGSPDNCPKIADQWAIKDKRIIVIHKKNGGLSSARNAGLEISNGEFVAFIDGDDWIESTYIERLVFATTNYKSGIGVIGFYRTFEDGRKIPSQYFIRSEEQFYPSPVNQAIKYFLENAIAVWGKLYSRYIIGNTRFIEGRLAEDIPFQTEILKKVTHVVFFNDHLYNYRQRSGSIARTIKPQYLYDHIKSLSGALEDCRQYFQFEVKYCISWLSSLLYEYCVSEDFSRKVEDKENLISYALNQCGGKEKLLENIYFPESIIYYTYSLFVGSALPEDLKKIQKDYRKIFPSIQAQKNKRQLLLKYLPCYFSLRLFQLLYRSK